MRTHINLTIVILATIAITAFAWQTLPLVHYSIIDDFLIISNNFFVKCSSENCASTLIPLIGYLLNLNTKYETFLAFNILLACITLWIYMLIALRLNSQDDLPYLEFYTLLSVAVYIHMGTLTPPDIITIFLAMSGLKLYFVGNKFSSYFLIAPLLISLNEWAIEYIILIVILLFSSRLKIQKKLLINLATLVIAGFLISQIYLFLIEYHSSWNFFSSPSLKEKFIHADFWAISLLICLIGSLCIFCNHQHLRHINTLLIAAINVILLILSSQLPYSLGIIPIISITTTNFVLLNAQYTQKQYSTS